MKTIELTPLSKSIQVQVSIPGSKSYTNRVLFLAALSNSTVKISSPLLSDDTRAMIDCLKTLGVKILAKRNSIEVSSSLESIPDRTYYLDADLSGTTIRFMLALATLIAGTKVLTGKEGLNKRPIAELVDGLTQLGAKIEYLGKIGYPPVKILSSKLKTGTIKIKGSISSQYISALLMIAPFVGKLTIEVEGEQISKPYIDMTIDTMKHFGVNVLNEKFKKYTINSGQRYKAKQYKVEGDLSSAGYFLAIAALTKSKITLGNINLSSKQADMQFVKMLEKMGNKITFGENEITITGNGVKPASVDMTDCPDQIQTLAVLSAFANGISKISGISSLRIKETDRVFALREELKKMGIKTSATKDVLIIHGGNPKASLIETYGDHRMAMSFAVAGGRLAGMKIVDPDVVNKTFPQFWDKLSSIGIKTKTLNSKNIILIGMRGSGKTTVAKILSKKLKKRFIETDELAVKKAGLTIPEIVQKFGWNKFRQLESEAVKEAVSSSSKIISTGGGVVLDSHNIALLKKNGLIFYLKCQPDTLVKRTRNDFNRPALTAKKTLKGEVQEVLKQREKLYKKAADNIIDTDNLNPEEVVNLILSKIDGINVCMIIGDPIKQSLSPKIHNAGYQALGIDNEFVFVPKRVPKNNLKSALKKAGLSGIKGISVTIPHKQNVIKYLDAIDPVAKKISAVNTVVNDHGKLTGFNTDWIGALTALEKKTNLKGKKIAVVGAGGAARAIIYGLKKKGSMVKIFNRSLNHAKKLAKEFGCEYGGLDSLEEILKMDVVINATSVGMNEDKSLIDKKFLNKNQIVLDVVYSPKETRLIKDAKEKGARVVFGYEMLLYQGVEQFKLYTGFDAPVDAMKEVLIKNLT